MLNVHVICIGKLKEKYLKDACAESEKRLKAYCKFTIEELSEEKISDQPKQSQIDKVLQCEGKRILNRVDKNSKVIALCIEGTMVSSQELAAMVQKMAVEGTSHISFIIGGSWGLSEEVKDRADFKLSMSKMTFPHQLARVILCEQIYRTFQISSGGKYHK